MLRPAGMLPWTDLHASNEWVGLTRSAAAQVFENSELANVAMVASSAKPIILTWVGCIGPVLRHYSQYSASCKARKALWLVVPASCSCHSLS